MKLGRRALPTELLHLARKRDEVRVAKASELPPGKVIGAGDYAVGNAGGTYFAVSRSCRHLAGDLANGTLDRQSHLVCPLHGAKYDVNTGRMIKGPRGIYARIPGLGAAFKGLTHVLPLFRAKVIERGGDIFIRPGS